MRRQVKLLANFLGATKELTGEYAELAGVTEDELNQIQLTVASRPDRKETARLLHAKGFSTRQIAELTGWSFNTIARDLRVSNDTETVSNATADSTTSRASKDARAAAVAETAAREGATPAPTDKYRIVYADPPWSYGNTMPDIATEPRDHYPVMELEAICAIPVKEWVEDN